MTKEIPNTRLAFAEERVRDTTQAMSAFGDRIAGFASLLDSKRLASERSQGTRVIIIGTDGFADLNGGKVARPGFYRLGVPDSSSISEATKTEALAGSGGAKGAAKQWQKRACISPGAADTINSAIDSGKTAAIAAEIYFKGRPRGWIDVLAEVMGSESAKVAIRKELQSPNPRQVSPQTIGLLREGQKIALTSPNGQRRLIEAEEGTQVEIV